MLSCLLNIIHLFIIFFPILIFLFKKEYKNESKFFLLIAMLIPMHWVFFDNNCISTVISKKLGDFRETTTNSAFSEVYLKWLYKPIMNIICLEWNDDGINKMIHLHWIINYLLIWYYTFYY